MVERGHGAWHGQWGDRKAPSGKECPWAFHRGHTETDHRIDSRVRIKRDTRI
jgi:hypothetical protein